MSISRGEEGRWQEGGEGGRVIPGPHLSKLPTTHTSTMPPTIDRLEGDGRGTCEPLPAEAVSQRRSSWSEPIAILETVTGASILLKGEEKEKEKKAEGRNSTYKVCGEKTRKDVQEFLNRGRMDWMEGGIHARKPREGLASAITWF